MSWNLASNTGVNGCLVFQPKFYEGTTYTGHNDFRDYHTAEWFGLGLSNQQIALPGGASGRADFDSVRLKLALNGFDPLEGEIPCFFYSTANGYHVDEVSIEKWAMDDRNPVSIVLHDARVSEFRLFPTQYGYPAVELAFTCGEIRVKHKQYDDQGQVINITEFGWDLAANQPR